jgi:hypothetical protein
VSEFRYIIYLNGVEITDYPSGLDDFTVKLIRSGGVTNEDQIIRQMTDVELEFSGDGYCLLCAVKKEQGCGDVPIQIFYTCENYRRLIFNGLIPLTSIRFRPAAGVATVQIRDNSWSGKIRERGNAKMFLNVAKSVTGQAIAPTASRTISFFDFAGAYTFNDRIVYDVWEVFKYLVRAYTNNTVAMVSDYFSVGGYGYKRWAITTGGMLYYGSPAAENTNIIPLSVPSVSFNEVFREVRKKTRIYMQVSTDVNGNATIRIEPESYFFTEDLLMEIEGMPLDLIETVDLEQYFSEIRIGSKTIEVDDGFFYKYPRLFLDSWQEESFNNCTECVEQNTLDLVSEWIIDSNVIHYTIDGQTPSRPEEVEHGQEVFLIETKTDAEQAAQYDRGGNYYYNDSLINSRVFERWAGGLPQCVEKFIKEQCISSCTVPLTINIPFTISLFGIDGITPIIDADCNSQQYIDMDFRWFSPPDARVRNMGLGSAGTNRAYFVAPVTGIYTFTISGDWSVTGTWADIRLYLGMAHFNSTNVLESGADESANLIAEYLEQSVTITSSGQTGNITLTVSVPMNAGDVLIPFRYSDFTNFTGNFQFPDGICWNLVSYNITDQLNFVADDILRLPLQWDLVAPLCDEDYNAIQNDPRGVVVVNNKPAWVREIEYNPKGLSTFKLMAKDSQCC